MSEHEYNGPRIPRTPHNETQVRLRFRRHVEAVAGARFDEAMKAWAAADDGRFPNKDQIRREVAAELETLCRALDGWGAVTPDTMLGPDWEYDLRELFE